jgi:hypothetical protein
MGRRQEEGGEIFWRAEGSKLQKRGRKGEEKERAGEDGQAVETKKKRKPDGAKLLRNELEGRNKFEKGDRGGLQRSRNRGDFRVQS